MYMCICACVCIYIHMYDFKVVGKELTLIEYLLYLH